MLIAAFSSLIYSTAHLLRTGSIALDGSSKAVRMASRGTWEAIVLKFGMKLDEIRVPAPVLYLVTPL